MLSSNGKEQTNNNIHIGKKRKLGPNMDRNSAIILLEMTSKNGRLKTRKLLVLLIKVFIYTASYKNTETISYLIKDYLYFTKIKY
jgi:hypothetical protein